MRSSFDPHVQDDYGARAIARRARLEGEEAARVAQDVTITMKPERPEPKKPERACVEAW